MTVKQAQSLPSLKNKQSRRFRPSATESFVLVKPPPTVSAHHPLNLQIQYISPSIGDSARPRSTSSSSEKSGSETSNGTSGRSGRIVPLYNLHTHSHNLLANSIHDAGTDVKIAKFQRQGVDVVDLGLFTPVEAWTTASPDSDDAPSATRVTSLADVTALLPEPSNEPPRKLLGKLFPGKALANMSDLAPSPPLSDYHPEYTLPPILGTIPTLLSKTVPPQGRAVSHTFICKRWYKEGGDNWIAQTLHLSGQEKAGVDIRLEWARALKRESDAPSRKSSSGNLQNESLSRIPPVPSLPGSPVPDEPRGRPPLNLTIPATPMFCRRKASTGSMGRTSDVEYDSDPEDSEVPWVCSVVIRPSKDLLRPPTPGEVQEPPLRLKVASLAPAPHHPKVVAQLKVQYPLPDIDLFEATLLQNRRLPGAPGSAPEGRLVLTAEEIKDLICSTVMWLACREFSGFSKKDKRRLS